jgi:hypothetical protein
MTAKELISTTKDVRVLGTATFAINTATTTNANFGAPADINLATNAAVRPGDRVLVVITAPRTAGAGADAISFSIQDADDAAGAFGTPATAVTDGSLAGGTVNQYALVAVKVQAGRPWLRVRATRAGVTDTHQVSVSVLAVARSGA